MRNALRIRANTIVRAVKTERKDIDPAQIWLEREHLGEETHLVSLQDSDDKGWGREVRLEEMNNSRKKLRVLFVCIGNSCRSPMAEAIALRDAADLFDAESEIALSSRA